MFGTRQLRHPKASKTRLFAETAHIDGNITSSLAREPGVRAGRAPRRLYGRIYDVPNVLNRGSTVGIWRTLTQKPRVENIQSYIPSHM